MLNPLRIGVLDAHEIARYGLYLHLLEQPDIAVVGSYASYANAIQDVREKELDLLLIGHLPPGSNRLTLIKAMSTEQPELRVLVLLDQPDWATAVMLVASGAHGIVCKTQPLCDYVKAIHSLVQGELYFCPRLIVQASLVNPFGTHPGHAVAVRARLAMLTPRERDILHLCAGGATVTQIAADFTRSVKTISAQKRAAYRKLGLKNDLDLYRCFPQRLA